MQNQQFVAATPRRRTNRHLPRRSRLGAAPALVQERPHEFRRRGEKGSVGYVSAGPFFMPFLVQSKTDPESARRGALDNARCADRGFNARIGKVFAPQHQRKSI